MIKIDNVSFSYQEQNHALNGLSLHIKKNEKIAIIGKSGCGKTTLLYLLGSILKPLSGNIMINDEALTTYRKQSSIVFQNGGLFPWKTVQDNLELGLKIRGINKEERMHKINTIMSELNIKAYKNRYIKELSGGQKQRVQLARSLVLDADLLLLDEPSSALDAMTKEQFQEIMLTLYNKHKLTSVIVTHDIFEAVYLGERIVVMNDGKIKTIIENELYGANNAKDSIDFYKKCIAIKELLE